MILISFPFICARICFSWSEHCNAIINLYLSLRAW